MFDFVMFKQKCNYLIVFRGRQDDDKWEHDLFDDDDEPRLSSMLLAITFSCLFLLTVIECLCVSVWLLTLLY